MHLPACLHIAGLGSMGADMSILFWLLIAKATSAISIPVIGRAKRVKLYFGLGPGNMAELILPERGLSLSHSINPHSVNLAKENFRYDRISALQL